MTKQTAGLVAAVFGVLGILFMLIMAFELFGIPRMYALFFGVACFIIAPAVRRMAVN